MDIETGRIFRELRREKGISLAEASNGVLSVSQLSHFERGEGDLTIEKFFALLQNMDISINEFSMFSKKDSSSALFEQAGKLEQEGNIDDLFKLYENERIIYRKTKEKQAQLNEIALKSILINYGKFERLTVIEQEVLESYFYEIKEWKFSNLRFFAFTLSQMDIESILFYLDDILEQDRLNDNDLVLMILRNTIYVLEQNNQKEKAKIYMNKFKSLIPEVGTVEIGISYATQEANLYEISGNFGAAIKILEKIAETYENFFMPKKSKIYREEIKKLQQKL
ncbi:Rgg/GadR/MutR family transcriptional regulator [Lactococcus allomyrinae]|uniref:Rgg/GadR/MutR family transcriptional regulator n=1 Tax=Lactococcus allomyrinae TaxID=2419773 RepID=A0A387BIC7_9LACT|nr:Rgg/GadR/MutR family transcriptional regulator [Lactococcus allomyrinae]AYG01972.1 Rgg/GadR/MutR family transcriptional regulator [Lactococcus allomyrinae]